VGYNILKSMSKVNKK